MKGPGILTRETQDVARKFVPLGDKHHEDNDSGDKQGDFVQGVPFSNGQSASDTTNERNHLRDNQQKMGSRIGKQTGTRLVKSIPTALARLRACPIEASCPCSLYSGGKDPCSSSIVSINSVTCELMDRDGYWLGSSDGD